MKVELDSFYQHGWGKYFDEIIRPHYDPVFRDLMFQDRIDFINSYAISEHCQLSCDGNLYWLEFDSPAHYTWFVVRWS